MSNSVLRYVLDKGHVLIGSKVSVLKPLDMVARCCPTPEVFVQHLWICIYHIQTAPGAD